MGSAWEINLSVSKVYVPGGIEERMLLCLRAATSRCWRKAVNEPVLKHGPRSLTCTRVGGWKTHKRK
jgi:hypothetical protein